MKKRKRNKGSKKGTLALEQLIWLIRIPLAIVAAVALVLIAREYVSARIVSTGPDSVVLSYRMLSSPAIAVHEQLNDQTAPFIIDLAKFTASNASTALEKELRSEQHAAALIEIAPIEGPWYKLEYRPELYKELSTLAKSRVFLRRQVFEQRLTYPVLIQTPTGRVAAQARIHLVFSRT